MIAFLDANVIIYQMEGEEPFAYKVRAGSGLKTPDCLQAACCLQLGQDHVFLTGDAAFKRVAGLKVKLLG